MLVDTEYYVPEVTKVLNEKYGYSFTEKQIKSILLYFTKNICKTMFHTEDVHLQGYLKIKYNKNAVMKYHKGKSIRS